MYVVPILLLILIAVGIFFGPLLAGILLIVGLIAIGALKFAGGGEPEAAPPPDHAASPPGGTTMRSDEDEGGMWGETWPEERAEETSPSETSASDRRP